MSKHLTKTTNCCSSTAHQLGGDGEAGAVLLGQLHFDRLGCLDGLERAGQVLHSHFQADLIVLRVHALHLVLVKEVGLQEVTEASSEPPAGSGGPLHSSRAAQQEN